MICGKILLTAGSCEKKERVNKMQIGCFFLAQTDDTI